MRAEGLARRLVVPLCFGALLLLGLAIHRDYGFAFDEEGQRENGVMSLRYVVQKLAPAYAETIMGRVVRAEAYPEARVPLDRYSDRDYGVAFEAPAVALEALLGLRDMRDIILFRHLLTFLAWFAGACVVYSLARRRFAHRGMGLLAVALLVASPRLFADAFYNSKDAVLMAAVAVALNTMIVLALRPGPRLGVVHALATAFAIDVRIVGIFLPVATVGLMVLRVVKGEMPRREAIVATTLYLFTTALFVVAFWPWLWTDPLKRFAEALASMSSFRFDREVLYAGDYVRGTDLPWHYIPVWIAITTPLFHLLLLVVGAVAVGWQLLRSGPRLWRDDGQMQDLVFLGAFVAPIVAVIVLHSVLYDGWRQLYFVYPAALLVCLRGWHTLAVVGRPALVAATALALGTTAFWMVRVHPLQNVYFNDLAGGHLKARFELDYWGLATRRGLEQVLAQDPSPSIAVAAANWVPLEGSIMIQQPSERRRLHVAAERGEAAYLFVSNLAAEREIGTAPYRERYDPFYEIRVDGEMILAILKRKGR